ncbi:MAG: amino acid permease [Planctomycetota bacterium]|nr:amino acid permease [Planctomycetota bacterium]
MSQASDVGRVAASPKRRLSLFDSTSIIVGIIIGSSIYESSPMIASRMGGPLALVGVWVLGAVLSLIGALCYAELATAYPADGGDYVYLTRAFGRPVGFMFAWAQLWIVRPGSVGAMAYVFARYANELWPLGTGAGALIVYAGGAVVVLTVINMLGLRPGKWTQNVLTTVKFVGLCAIVVAGFFASSSSGGTATAVPATSVNLSLAMIFILYAYGGWNEMAYVAAEVRDPGRNILRSLVLGMVAVTGVYVLLNLAFVNAFGFEGLCGVTVGLVIGFGRKADGFGSLVNFTTPVFWIFFLLVGVSLVVLRVREPGTPRPYRVPLYPVIPALFCLSSLFMLHASFDWAWKNRSLEALWSLVILGVGLGLSFCDTGRGEGRNGIGCKA